MSEENETKKVPSWKLPLSISFGSILFLAVVMVIISPTDQAQSEYEESWVSREIRVSPAALADLEQVISRQGLTCKKVEFAWPESGSRPSFQVDCDGAVYRYLVQQTDQGGWIAKFR